jgi:outer membrane receptor protein involved in Fe transport
MMPWLLALVLLQSPATVSGVVTDGTGATIPAALITLTAGTIRQVTTTGADGTWTVTLPAGAQTVSVRAEAPGFGAVVREVTLPASSVAIELQPERIAQDVTVTAETSVSRLAVESSVTSIGRHAIAAAPALRLDDQLRVVPGFSLFRRTSSAVANPTTQGVTLRGLSASGASRTLVVADDVPLNDAFGGWVYWDRIPMVSLQRIDVMRGASGDIHGNDALGGVIRLATRTGKGAEAWLEGGSHGTARASGYAGFTSGRWSGGGAYEGATTDGYRVVAPEVRGTIDVEADSRSKSGIGWIGATRRLFQTSVRGGYFNENRGNGTPGQLNATVSRWAGANATGVLLGGVWEARGDATFTNYRQTFSAIILPARAAERLTSLQWVGSSAGGGGFTWLRQGRRAQALFGVSSRLAKAKLDEAAISIAGIQGPVVRTRARQRGDGIVAQGRFEATPRVTLDGGVRIDYWRLSNREDPEFSVRKLLFIEPRVGASFQLSADRVLRVSWLTGFRTPTMNELYRAFRVGSTLTNANDRLEPEESWGPEVAFTMRRDRFTGRAIFYATRLTGAIYNRTLVSTPTSIVRERSNGQARAIGSELELEWRPGRGIVLTSAWALNDSKFTEGELEGKRIPQVPRASGSIGFRAEYGRWGAAANVRVIGAQYDDDRNELRLGAGSLSDARVAWRWSRRLELFGAVENAFDQDIDTGRTPLRTIGSPRVSRAGVMVRF